MTGSNMGQNGMDVKSALALMRDDMENGAVLRELADDIGVSDSTLSRWLSDDREPTGTRRRLLLEWASRKAADHAPISADQNYWRGVLFAAESMNATVTQLLRQAREAGDRQTTRQSILAVTPPQNTAHPPASETTPRRQPKG